MSNKNSVREFDANIWDTTDPNPNLTAFTMFFTLPEVEIFT